MSTPSFPFEPLHIRGESITLDISGKILVIPTGNPAILPRWNEYALTPGREVLTNGTYTFTNNFNVDTGLQNMISPWIAWYNPSSNEIDFCLFTHIPTNLKCIISDGAEMLGRFVTQDGEAFTTADGNYFDVITTEQFISSLILYPGNGMIYHGRITYPDLTRDTNDDLIPNCIRSDTEHFATQDSELFTTADGNFFDVPASEYGSDYGSVHNFLKSYGVVRTKYSVHFATQDSELFTTADGNYFDVYAL